MESCEEAAHRRRSGRGDGRCSKNLDAVRHATIVVTQLHAHFFPFFPQSTLLLESVTAATAGVPHRLLFVLFLGFGQPDSQDECSRFGIILTKTIPNVFISALSWSTFDGSRGSTIAAPPEPENLAACPQPNPTHHRPPKKRERENPVRASWWKQGLRSAQTPTQGGRGERARGSMYPPAEEQGEGRWKKAVLARSRLVRGSPVLLPGHPFTHVLRSTNTTVVPDFEACFCLGDCVVSQVRCCARAMPVLCPCGDERPVTVR